MPWVTHGTILELPAVASRPTAIGRWGCLFNSCSNICGVITFVISITISHEELGVLEADCWGLTAGPGTY